MHKRILLIGGVGLVKGNIKDAGKAMVSICDELEPSFSGEMYENTPFETVSLIFRYGTKITLPEIGRINKKHAELEVAVELPMSELRIMRYDDLRARFKAETLRALIAIGDKYGCRNEIWESMLMKL